MTHTGAQGEACSASEAPRWRVLLDQANAGPRCGATCKRTGQPCRGAAMPNGRCRLHGGTSTGARTPDGKARCQAAPRKHGERDAAARASATQRGAARRLVSDLGRLLAQLGLLQGGPSTG